MFGSLANSLGVQCQPPTPPPTSSGDTSSSPALKEVVKAISFTGLTLSLCEGSPLMSSSALNAASAPANNGSGAPNGAGGRVQPDPLGSLVIRGIGGPGVSASLLVQATWHHPGQGQAAPPPPLPAPASASTAPTLISVALDLGPCQLQLTAASACYAHAAVMALQQHTQHVAAASAAPPPRLLIVIIYSPRRRGHGGFHARRGRRL